ncbi:MAG: hypothetical protein ACI97A_000414 [Planctomycetota bacterium]|jgi:hypothetical protein
MNAFLTKLKRQLIVSANFFRSQEDQVALERRLRGKDEANKLADADCSIVSFGKSGRTWLRVMISGFYQAKHGLSESQMVVFDNLHRKNPEIPKLFFTHDNYLKDATGNSDSKSDYYGKKVIFLARHPGDVAVSQFFQWQHRMRNRKMLINDYPSKDDQLSIHDFVVGEKAGLPKIIDFMNLWANESSSIGDFLLIKYEDMKSEPAQTLRRVLDFIGTPGTDAEIEQAVAYSSFDNMKKMEEKRTFWLSGSRMVPKDRNNPHSFKVRRGKVGGFRDYFDENEEAAIEKLINGTLSPFFGYESIEAPAVSAEDHTTGQ